MKSKLDQLDSDKLETTPDEFKKLSDVVKNVVVKKTVYDELVEKVNAIKTVDTSDILITKKIS